MRVGLAGLAVVGLLAVTACAGDDTDVSTVSTTAPSTTVASTTSSAAPGSTTTTELALEARDYEVGDCVTFDQREQNAASKVVPCAEPHLIEIVGAAQLSDPTGSAYPGDSEWVEIYGDKCGGLVQTYLDEPFDPYGRFALAGIQPTRAGWEAGDRELWCGIILAGPAGEDWASWQGSARDVPQARIRPPGTCLEQDAGAVVEIPCAESHRYEIVGSVDLSASFSGTAAPSASEQEAVLRPACESVATAYLGKPLRSDLGVATFVVESESWAAGRRAGECALTVLADGNPSDSTGSLRS
ncbi:MAG TPA: septum formation family protein [Acidimicrobiales bacterium]